MMNKRSFVFAFAFIAFSMLLAGKSWAASYAYVDVATLFDEYEKTKKNDAMLKDVGETKEEERQKLVKEIRGLKDELVLLSDAAKTEKQEVLDSKIRELQEFDREAKRELGERRNRLVREIFKDIDEVVQRYGERKGFDMIFNERALLYHNDKLDVTKDILTELNKNYKEEK